MKAQVINKTKAVATIIQAVSALSMVDASSGENVLLELNNERSEDYEGPKNDNPSVFGFPIP